MQHITLRRVLLALFASWHPAFSQSPETYFTNPPDSGKGSLYGTDQVLSAGSTINVTWVTNETDFGIWLWQQNTDTSIASVDEETSIYESANGNSDTPATHVMWKVTTGSFSLKTSNVFFLNIGEFPSLEDNYATCHYFNITDQPVSTTSTPGSSSSTTSSSSTSTATAATITANSQSSGTSSSDSSGSPTSGPVNSTAQKVGLGVGLGVGIPLVLVLLGFLVLRIRKSRQDQQTAPSPSDPATEAMAQTYPVDKKEIEPMPPQNYMRHELPGAEQRDPQEMEDSVPAELEAQPK